MALQAFMWVRVILPTPRRLAGIAPLCAIPNQMFLGLTAPWEVSAVNIAPASADRPLGEIAAEVAWAIADTAGLPELRTGPSAPWRRL